MVAPAVHPARHPHVAAHVAGAQVAGPGRAATTAPESAAQKRRGVYVALADEERLAEAFVLARELRMRDVIANIEQAGRSLKGQLKHADRVGAKYVVIFGEGIEIKDMVTGQQLTVASAQEAINVITAERS